MTPVEERLLTNVAKGIALLRALEILLNESPLTTLEANIYLAHRAQTIVRTARSVGSLDVVDEASAQGFAGTMKLAERLAENERIRQN